MKEQGVLRIRMQQRWLAAVDGAAMNEPYFALTVNLCFFFFWHIVYGKLGCRFSV